MRGPFFDVRVVPPPQRTRKPLNRVVFACPMPASGTALPGCASQREFAKDGRH